MMKPILFNTEMVRAILDGQKTVTRRIVKVKGWNITGRPDWGNTTNFFFNVVSVSGRTATALELEPPYYTGDILYVRETWNGDWCDHYIYKADGGSAIAAGYAAEPKWRPSIHMPKEAARIFLRVKATRVERIQDISSADVVSEGLTMLDRFSDLWDSTVRPADRDKYGWDANPWVWVIEFERCEKPKEDVCKD